MTKTSKRSADRRRRALTILAALGGLASGWAFFLWYQLLRARGGEDPICAFESLSDCERLWDGAFAGAVHRMSGLPVAGWGLVWGLAALLLPLFALAAGERGLFKNAAGAIRLLAIVGLAGVVVLLGISFWEGGFCSNCVLTYLLTFAYGAVALRSLKAPIFSEGSIFAALLLVTVGYALLLYPGLRTPKSSRDAGQQAVADAARQIAPPPAPDGSAPGAPPAAPGTELESFLASLSPELEQLLSDVLERYRHAPVFPPESPRAPLGDPRSGLLITEFTDVKCGHCADLHQTMAYVLNAAPGRFALDSRQYPLDGNCNPRLQVRGPETVRCLAARVLICAEGIPERFDLSGELFARQSELTPEIVLTAANRYLPQMALDACLASSSTEARLRADVEYADRYNPRGTPLVLINGREASPFGPFLFAMVLAGGDPDHPAFADLPPPRDLPEHDHAH